MEPVTQTPVIPSVLCVMDDTAQSVLIGQEAVTYNWDGQAAGSMHGFKKYLGTESPRTMAPARQRSFTAHDAAAPCRRELTGAL